MRPAEIPFRIGREARIRVEQFWPQSASSTPRPDLTHRARPWIGDRPQVPPQRYIRAADRIVAGQIDLFSAGFLDIGSPPHWNRDPKTGIDAPLRYGKTLDYRNPKIVGDIKYLWELNRHLHLVTLAQAYTLSRDQKYFDALQRQLESWFDACPVGRGPNWSSALECALRLINWAIGWQMIGGVDAAPFSTPAGSAFRSRWLTSIYRHARFIRGYFSRHSSANNHLIGEACGLYVAAITWPHWARMRRWRTHAQRVIEREALLQNTPDGVNREQAIGYQQFEFDLLLLAVLAGRAGRCELSADVSQRMMMMLEFLASIMDVGGNLPALGDSDDGFVTRLSSEPGFCPFRSLFAAGVLLFGRDDFRAAASELDDKTRWLFGSEADGRFSVRRPLPPHAPVRRAFPEGGYYILGCSFGTADEIRLVADAGPIGYGTIAAHGHADALAFTLSVGGLEFFVDPGTYIYYADHRWRSYFRGTSAHNTVRVDGADQSESGGNFMWLAKAEAGCSRWQESSDCDVFEGWHNGYVRLADPVSHRRRIELDKMTRRITIDDSLQMQGAHDIELFFHLAENCTVTPSSYAYAIESGCAGIDLFLPRVPEGRATLYRGETLQPLGWRSRRFGAKLPAPTIAWRARVTGDTILRTVIQC